MDNLFRTYFSNLSVSLSSFCLPSGEQHWRNAL
jgi:hypothetical protein